MGLDLQHAAQNLREDDLDMLARLDRHGWLWGPGESFPEYLRRIQSEAEALARLETDLQFRGMAKVDGTVSVRAGDRIPPEILNAAAETTHKLFAFKLDWAPGFFVREGVGWLWGGCAWHDEERDCTMFLIRNDFRNSEKYLIYSRRELVAHELCHVARAAFVNDWQLEEFFAYRTSQSALRRYMGNCFSTRWDAWLFLAPSLLILVAQLVNVFLVPIPIWPAWAILVLGLGYLLWRNHRARQRFFRARHKLRSWLKQNAQAVLFRSTWEEIGKIGKMHGRNEFFAWARKQAETEPRWRVIEHRFLHSTRDKKDKKS